LAEATLNRPDHRGFSRARGNNDAKVSCPVLNFHGFHCSIPFGIH